MKKILFMPLACLTMHAIGQNITVRDNSTREPIENVIIKDKNNKTVTTNAKGQATLEELDKSDSLWVWHTSYTMKKIVAGSDNIEVNMTAKAIVLDEIIFSANRSAEKKIDVPYSMQIIKQKDIEFSNQPTSADLLQNTGAVFVQKSQLGGGSAVLRGFEANKTLIVLDGIRMNNAIYRGGHLQDLITLDANMLDRTEVIFGPASTMYGSDALGGVMHFYTKNAEFSADSNLLLKLNSMVRYAGAANEITGHLDFNLGFKKFASLTNITYSSFGDLLSGNTNLDDHSPSWDRLYYAERINGKDSMVSSRNKRLQVPSGYSQLDIMQRFNFKSGSHILHNINLQMSTSSNINRYDRLSEYSGSKLKFAEWYYGPQNRRLAAYSLNYSKPTVVSDHIKVILACQNQEQDRISRRFGNDNRVSQMEDVTVLSANIDLFKKISKHELRYGFEMTQNFVNSTAKSLNIATNTETTAATRYADGGNSMSTQAVYFSHSWEVNETFVISDGLRFTANQLRSEFKDTTFFKFPFKTAEQTNEALTGSIGFTWKEDNDYKVSILFNSGFRTPNIDDMSKVFESTNSVLIVPNPDIKPEYAYNCEISMSKVFEKKFKFDITGFYTFLENALVQRDAKLNGRDSAVFNGVLTKIQSMQNANEGYVYGLTTGLQFNFNEQVSFKSIFNYTYGRYIDTKTGSVVPLDHIPPVFGQSSLTYKGKNTDAEFFVRYNGKKDLSQYSPSGEDNLQYATPNGMPAWFTLNIRAGYNITKNIRVNAACENMSDNNYRVFASGINAPGRNFIVSLRFKM